jgi:16S rRNA (adenine1518-N6/adenine1519-N6)-dimethyltransferase
LNEERRTGAKKSLGQNFLVNREAARGIVDGLGLERDELVFEIGPGKGALTEILASRGVRVTAFEIDRALAASLEERFAENEAVEIVREDILKVDFDLEAGKRGGTRYKIIGNIPYMLTSSILLKIPGSEGYERALIMVQKEVADRILTPAGKRSCGLLTVFLQSYSSVNRLMKLSAGSFSPRPGVNSAVLAFTPRRREGAPGNREGYFAFLKMAFSQRRKQLKNSLSGAGGAEGVDFAGRLEYLSGIELARRAETLDLEEWFLLFKAYETIKGCHESD